VGTPSTRLLLRFLYARHIASFRAGGDGCRGLLSNIHEPKNVLGQLSESCRRTSRELWALWRHPRMTIYGSSRRTLSRGSCLSATPARDEAWGSAFNRCGRPSPPEVIRPRDECDHAVTRFQKRENSISTMSSLVRYKTAACCRRRQRSTSVGASTRPPGRLFCSILLLRSLRVPGDLSSSSMMITKSYLCVDILDAWGCYLLSAHLENTVGVGQSQLHTRHAVLTGPMCSARRACDEHKTNPQLKRGALPSAASDG
jgi:hypothetical protein